MSSYSDSLLHRWQRAGHPPVARRALFVLWSARGWSVPALARAFGCCRRTVRRCLHAFLSTGLAGLQASHAARRAREPATVPDCATDPEASLAGGRLVPVVPVSIPELRRILAFHWFNDPVNPAFFWHWSIYRHYKQALAKRIHYKKRRAMPPEFEQVRL
jgi:hypothetical protein